MQNDYLEICSHLSYDALTHIDSQKVSADKRSVIWLRYTQMLILLTTAFLLKEGKIPEIDSFKETVLKHFPDSIPLSVIIMAQRVIEEIDYIDDPEYPEQPYIKLDYVTCVCVVKTLFDVEEIYDDSYLEANHWDVKFIAESIEDSIEQLWHIIHYGE